MQPSSKETDGGFFMSEVEEQQAARVEVQDPKRRVIRVESEETHDYVRERLAIRQEEADEIGFVPSASREPRGVYCWCENRCSEKALRYMQTASMVIEEGGEARTINLFQRWYNEKLVQQGKQSLKSKEGRETVERKAHRGRLWKIFGSEELLRGMWESFTLKRAWARKILAGAAHEKQEGTQGQWQQEPPFKEVVEQVKRIADTDCSAQIMRRAYKAKKLCNCERFKEKCRKEGKLCECTFQRFRTPMTRLPWKISAACALRRTF